MFEEYYEFKQTPFSRGIPTNKLYRGIGFNELVDRLKYAASRQLFAVLTGDCGVGKTTALRRFSDELKPAEHVIMYISDSKLTPRYFYKGLLEQLGFDSKWHSGDAKRQLHREIELIRAANGPMPTVIVDEAHWKKEEKGREGMRKDEKSSSFFLVFLSFSSFLQFDGLTKPDGAHTFRSAGALG